ncbi:MAG: membrane dipeptidase [Alphaproteobacteria bacterium]|nr:membrane dipeptidase [Alphaproteobacteria bacterium]
MDALAFHREHMVVDSLSLFFVTEERWADRWLEGGINATICTVGLEEPFEVVLRNIDTAQRRIAASPNMVLATTADDMLAARRAGKLAIMMGTQGCSFVGPGDLWRIEHVHKMGVRSLGLAYTSANMLADGCGERRDAGVSYLGQDVIQAVNALPMMLDLSHCGHRTRAEATALARAPICTHSNAYDLVANDRNTRDETARAIVAKGGMMGVVALPRTVKAAQPTLEDLVDHVDHFRRVIGAGAVGFGIDSVEGFAGNGPIVPPAEVVRWRTRRPDIFGPLSDFGVERYPLAGADAPKLTEALFARGYAADEVAGIIGGNWIRCIRNFCG